MKKTTLIPMTVAAGLLLTTDLRAEEEKSIQGSIAVAKDVPETELAAKATVSLNDALKAACADHKGKVIKAELESEKGFLVWSIELSEDNTITEVVIDAGSGKVLATENETPRGEKSEKSEDKD